MRVKQAALLLCFLCAAIIGIFIVGELVVRVCISRRGQARVQQKAHYLGEIKGRVADRSNSICVHDEDIGMHYIPNSAITVVSSDFSVEYKINSRGQRDVENAYASKSGDLRIIALGDSYTFGEGIQYGDRFTEVIERICPGVEVINMGVQAYGIDQSLLFLEKEGFQYNPDLVVVFIQRPNLERCGLFFCSAYKPRFELDQHGELVMCRPFKDAAGNSNSIGPGAFLPDTDTRESQTSPAFEQSAVLSLFNYTVRRAQLEKELQQKDRSFWEKNNKTFIETNKDKITGEQLSKTIDAIIDRYQDACLKHNAQLLFVNIDVVPLDRVAGHIRERGIAYYDLSGILSQYADRLYFKIDPHLNQFAHRLIGERVGVFVNESYAEQKK